MALIYKIRLKEGSVYEPGLYLKGTPAYHSYDKNGRVFSSLGALRTFLSNVLNNEYISQRSKIDEWEIVELEMVEREVKNVHEVITAKTLGKLLKR